MSVEEPQLEQPTAETAPSLESPVSRRQELEGDFSKLLEQLGISKAEIGQNERLLNELVNYAMTDAIEDAIKCLLKILRQYFANDQLLAEKLIEIDETNLLFECFPFLREINKKEIIAKLAATENYLELAYNIEILAENQEEKEKVGDLLWEKKRYIDLIHNLEKFPNIDQLALAQALFETDKSNYLAFGLNGFKNENKEKIIDQLIEDGKAYSLATNFSEYPKNIQDLIIKKLESQKRAEDLITFDEYLEQKGHNNVALMFLAEGKTSQLANNLNRLKNLSAEVAVSLIAAKHSYEVVRYLENFSLESHQQIALKLCEVKEYHTLFREWDKFSGLDKKEILQTMLAFGDHYNVMDNWSIFKESIDQDTALSLLEDNYSKFLVHLPELTNIDHLQLAERYIVKGNFDVVRLVMNNLVKFNLDHNKLALFLIEQNAGYENFFDNFKILNREAADALIAQGNILYILENLNKFKDFDRKALVKKALEQPDKEQYILIANNLSLFNLDEEEYRILAYGLINHGDADVLVNNYTLFKGLNQDDVIEKIIKHDKGQEIVNNIENFPGLSINELIDKMFEANSGDGIEAILKRGGNLPYSEISRRLWDKRWTRIMAKYLELFPDVNQQELLFKMIENNIVHIYEYWQNFVKVDKKLFFKKLSSQAKIYFDGGLVSFLVTHYHELGVSQDELIDELTAGVSGPYFINRIKGNLNFEDLDYKALGKRLLSLGRYQTVVENLEQFPDIDHRKLLQSLCINLDFKLIIKNLEKFKNVDYNWLIAEIVAPQSKSLIPYARDLSLTKFNNLNSESAKKILEFYDDGFFEIIQHQDSFENLDLKKLGALAFIAGKYEEIANNLEFFPDINQAELIAKLFMNKLPLTITYNLHKFKDVDYNQIFEQLLNFTKKDIPKAADYHLQWFKGLDIKYANTLINVYDDGFKEVVTNIDSFKNKEENKVLTAVLDIMPAEYLTRSFYSFCEDIYNGRQTPDTKKIGIKGDKESGLNELRNYLRKFNRDFVYGQVNVQEILDNDILRDYTQAFVRYDTSQWGSRDNDNFRLMLSNFLEDKFEPLKPEYKPSKQVNIKKVNQEAIQTFKHTEDFKQFYGAILDDIKSAKQLLVEPVARYKLKMETEKMLDGLRLKLAEQTNDQARANLKLTIEQIEKIDLNRLLNDDDILLVMKDLSVLAKGKEGAELRQLIRQNAFYANFKLNDVFIREDVLNFSAESPKINELAWVIDFMQHLINKENLKKHLKDSKIGRDFGNILSAKGLQDYLTLWLKQDTLGTMPMQFVPCRNINTLFSGYIADACWADHYRSILQEFPHFTTLLFVQNPQKEKDFRISGASFLIEAKSAEGEDVMIIRGLNPRENVINQLSTEDFIKELIEYLKPIAKSLKMKKIIIPLTPSGSSMTNRGAIAGYLGKYLADKPVVNLASEPKTEFNGYDISSNCRLLAEVE
ncbi:MAG: hypothetical protein NTZ49_05835 [Candidatus Parcubacteria bacterium]|nr:hypothetical protein [Candidatus Parcubacteria bacterium]